MEEKLYLLSIKNLNKLAIEMLIANYCYFRSTEEKEKVLNKIHKNTTFIELNINQIDVIYDGIIRYLESKPPEYTKAGAVNINFKILAQILKNKIEEHIFKPYNESINCQCKN